MRGVLGRAAVAAMMLAAFWGGQEILAAHEPANIGLATRFGFAAWLVGGYFAGMVAHELGHAVAVRLAGSKVEAIQFGGRMLRFTVAGVPVSAGIGFGGHVVFNDGRLPAARRALILLAGPLANLLLAGVSFLLPVPWWEATFIALAIAASALYDLVPAELGNGSPTDGAHLTRIPAISRAAAAVRDLLATPGWETRPGAADTLIGAYSLDIAEAADALRDLRHEPARLLPFYLADWRLPDKPQASALHIVDVLTWKTLCTGELPAETVTVAASRAEWVLAHRPEDSDDKRIALHRVQPTLALARLRQGRTAEVRRLCAGPLAAELDPGNRASALAIVAMAKHARLLSGQAELTEALALDPDAALVPEAVATLSRPPALLTADAATA